MKTKSNEKEHIGPVAVPNTERDENERIEDTEKPFVVDRDDPDQQELAKEVGWERLEEIAAEEKKAWKEASEL